MSAELAFERLRAAISEVTRGVPEIRTEVRYLGGARRLTMSRPLSGGGTRRIQVSFAAPDSGFSYDFDAYVVAYGEYGHRYDRMNYDAKAWGDLGHVVGMVRGVVVDWVPWETLARFVPPA